MISSLCSITVGTLMKIMEMPLFYIIKEDILAMMKFLDQKDPSITNYQIYKRMNNVVVPSTLA